MSRRKIILLLTVLALIGTTAGGLLRLRSAQRLGLPGVKTQVVAGAGNLTVLLPETVPGFTSQAVETSPVVTNMLPADTSFGQRTYRAADGFFAQMNVVLMGADRSSIHKPQLCLPAQGWTINQTEVTTIPVAVPLPYDLPVIKLTASNQLPVNGQAVAARGIYVYWFVADGELSADSSGWRRMLQSMAHLLRTGELQRWAYVSVFAVCEPGQEAALFERMKQLIAATVPEFQPAGGAAAKERR
ncbi:MAG: exosortase-associated EpsI family protein [Verrucomicrobia bacterium]|nr:exosortase-associated EpsI family protein [Verrucomicrobiota bacterium]